MVEQQQERTREEEAEEMKNKHTQCNGKERKERPLTIVNRRGGGIIIFW